MNTTDMMTQIKYDSNTDLNDLKLSETQKEAAIQNIVKYGVISPADRIRKLINVALKCPFRILFFGVSDCLFLGVLITACLWLFLIQLDTRIILCCVFALSPFAYIISFLLTSWKEHALQLYEIRSSCRYTMRQITALRMICFSFINMIINAAALMLLVKMQTAFIPFWKTLGLSFSSLFIYGVMMLFFHIKGKSFLSALIPPMLWCGSSLTAVTLCGSRIEGLLIDMADVSVAALLIAACAAYLLIFYSFTFYSFSATDRSPRYVH